MKATTMQVLEFIRCYVTEHRHAPSMQQIADGVGLATASSAFYHLQKLQETGHIRRDPNRPRTIVITEETL